MENSQDKKHIIGERIRLLREARGWVVGRLAIRLKMKIADFKAIENGRVEISASQLNRFAEALCVDVKKLGSEQPQDIFDMLADNITKPAQPRTKKPPVVDFEEENKKLRALIKEQEKEIGKLQKKLMKFTIN